MQRHELGLQQILDGDIHVDFKVTPRLTKSTNRSSNSFPL